MPFHIFKHPLVKEFYFQNKEFYDEVRSENYDIFEFARKMLRRRWTRANVLRYLAFGVGLNDWTKMSVLSVLEEEFPQWRDFSCGGG